MIFPTASFHVDCLTLHIFYFPTAYCDLASHLTCYTWAVKEAKRYGEKWNKKWAREKAYMKILAEIPDILEEYAIVSDKKQFTSWKHYLSDYFSKGMPSACFAN